LGVRDAYGTAQVDEKRFFGIRTKNGHYKDTGANRNKVHKPCPLKGNPNHASDISTFQQRSATTHTKTPRHIPFDTHITLVSKAGSTLSVLEFSISTSDPAIRISLTTKISIQQLSN